MKKTYKQPYSRQIHLDVESALMSGSDDTNISIETGGSEIDTPEEALTHKQSSIWDNWSN